MTEFPPVKNEFSRLVPPGRLEGADLVERIEASEAERAALAKRLDLLSLDRLEARVNLQRQRSGAALVRVWGKVSAAFVQACVVTLAPVPGQIEEEFELFYAYLPDAAPEQNEVLIDPEEADPPEIYGPAGIDIGEAVAQQLAVALDPYPRAAAAVLPADAAPEDGEDSPFAALKALKDDL